MLKQIIISIIVVAIYHFSGEISLEWVEGLLRDWLDDMQRTRELRLEPLQAVA